MCKKMLYQSCARTIKKMHQCPLRVMTWVLGHKQQQQQQQQQQQVKREDMRMENRMDITGGKDKDRDNVGAADKSAGDERGAGDDLFEWEVEPKDIKLGKLLGSGSFGDVYRGSWLGADVAGMSSCSYLLTFGCLYVCMALELAGGSWA
jgi:hypothetical protein